MSLDIPAMICTYQPWYQLRPNITNKPDKFCYQYRPNISNRPALISMIVHFYKGTVRYPPFCCTSVASRFLEYEKKKSNNFIANARFITSSNSSLDTMIQHDERLVYVCLSVCLFDWMTVANFYLVVANVDSRWQGNVEDRKYVVFLTILYE